LPGVFIANIFQGYQENYQARNLSPSSVFINLKKSHFKQLPIFSAYDPWTLPPQRVPATFQQHLPADLPLLVPL
jgi:hypothetical protein